MSTQYPSPASVRSKLWDVFQRKVLDLITLDGVAGSAIKSEFAESQPGFRLEFVEPGNNQGERNPLFFRELVRGWLTKDNRFWTEKSFTERMSLAESNDLHLSDPFQAFKDEGNVRDTQDDDVRSGIRTTAWEYALQAPYRRNLYKGAGVVDNVPPNAKDPDLKYNKNQNIWRQPPIMTDLHQAKPSRSTESETSTSSSGSLRRYRPRPSTPQDQGDPYETDTHYSDGSRRALISFAVKERDLIQETIAPKGRRLYTQLGFVEINFYLNPYELEGYYLDYIDQIKRYLLPVFIENPPDIPGFVILETAAHDVEGDEHGSQLIVLLTISFEYPRIL